MRRLSLILALAALGASSRHCHAQCNNQGQSQCPAVSSTTLTPAGTSQSITCLTGVTISSGETYGTLLGDVCYPTGHAATAPILAYFHGSSLTRDKVWVNATGTTMPGGLIVGALNGFAMWTLDYAADSAGTLAKWQSGRCALYKLTSSGGTTSFPGNPKYIILHGDSQGGWMAMFLSKNGGGFADQCDTTPVALTIARVVNNDGPSNWARNDLYAGGTYANTNATVQGIINTILACSTTSGCQTADAAASFSIVPYTPLSVPLFSTGGSADTYVPWTENCAEVVTAYGAARQGCAQLSGNHLGDTNTSAGSWWPWLMNAIQSQSKVAAGGGTSASGGY